MLAVALALVLAVAAATAWSKRTPSYHFCPAAASRPIDGGPVDSWQPGDPDCPPYGPIR